MAKCYEVLSTSLYEVLDDVGATESNRKKFWKSAMLIEIPFTFMSQFYDKSPLYSCYHFGSSCEGTTTRGLYSDIDMICCYEDMPVVESLVESKQQGTSYLISTDKDTKPGYVFLECVQNGCPISVEKCDVSEHSLFKINPKGNVSAKHFTVRDGHISSRNGPADTFPALGRFSKCDVVHALRCRQIPRWANYWIHKIRKYDWPSQKQLTVMGSYGCFFVGVGHPHSENKSIEWRISFSLQERDLMSSISETQHKCYILLKMIKKDFLELKAGESISSYHCKTALFYIIENSPKHIWKDCNLICCARLCLERLLIWVKESKCPNYFIPEDNMFDKISPMDLKKIDEVLNRILGSGIWFLYLLTCDNVGELFKSKVWSSELVYRTAKSTAIIQSRRLLCNCFTVLIYEVRNAFLAYMFTSSNTHTDYMNQTRLLLQYLKYTNHVTEHNTKDVNMAFEYIIPHIQLQYDQCLFAQNVSLRSTSIPNIISETIEFDLISSQLSLASLYMHYELLEEKCKGILVSCENSLKSFNISVCLCAIYLRYFMHHDFLDIDMTSKYFQRHYTTGCMAFMRSQVNLVHKSLHYELFRTVYTQQGPVMEILYDDCLNWITVDSKIYLYFLQYILYSKKTKQTEVELAVQKLKHVLDTEINLGHRETGLNLMGWIHLHNNELQTAWRLFCLSWKIRPFKNAAKWHMLMLLSEILTGD